VDDRLGARAHAELVEDRRDLVADRLLALAEVARDGVVVEAAREQLEHRRLGAGERRRARTGRRRRRRRFDRADEVVERRDEHRERRLGLEQDVVGAFEGEEASAGNQRREAATFVERHPRVAARVDDQRRHAQARRRVGDVGVVEAARVRAAPSGLALIRSGRSTSGAARPFPRGCTGW
jgi:hypothetical protein